MRLRHTVVASFLLGALTTEAAAQAEHRDPGPAREAAPPTLPTPPTPAEPADPMAAFARMIPGEWRVRFQSGTTQFDRWRWGPGRRSALVQTYGSDGGGGPWRSLTVFYQSPDGDEVRLLDLTPDIQGLGRGVGEGTIMMGAESADASFDLHQPGHPGRAVRALSLRWDFDGPDRYRETLLEDRGAGPAFLVGWDYARWNELSTLPPVPDEPDRPSGHLGVFGPLMGGEWEASGEVADGEAFQYRSTFEWIPYVGAVVARVTAPGADGEPAPLLDAYFYHHPSAGTLRCLALSAGGGMYEGVATVLEDGAVQVELDGAEGDRVVSLVAWLDPGHEGGPRLRVWSVEGGERTPMLDTRATRVEPGKD